MPNLSQLNEPRPCCIPTLMEGKFDLIPPTLRKLMRAMPDFRFWDTFVFLDAVPRYGSKSLSKALSGMAKELGIVGSVNGKTPLQELKEAREIPSPACSGHRKCGVDRR